MRRRLIPALLLGLALPALAAIDDSTPGAPGVPHVTTTADREEASLFALPTTHDHIGRVVIQATVNGQGPFRFIVDTGATHSTVSPSLVQALGLKPAEVPPIVLNGITGTAQVSAVTLERLQTGDLTIDGLVVPVVWAPVMAGADGILGAAGLTERTLSVDFARNRVRISHGIDTAVRADAMRIHATRVMHGLMVLEMQVGGVRALAVIDTGSERTLGNLALRDALKTRGRSAGMAFVTSVYGATQQVESGEIWQAPPLVLDALRINDVAVVYGDFHIFKLWDMQSMPAAIIGMDVLGTVGSFGIDFKNRDVYFTSSRAPHQMFSPSAVVANPMQHR